MVSPYIRKMGHMKRREQYEKAQRDKLAARPHAILMRFQRFPNGWQVRFTPVGSEWVLRLCTFADPEKIRTLFRRSATRKMSEDVAILEYALQRGSGVVELRLKEEEYANLKDAKH